MFFRTYIVVAMCVKISEGAYMDLICRDTMSVRILDVAFGNWTADCFSTHDVISSPKATNDMRDACDGQQSCRLWFNTPEDFIDTHVERQLIAYTSKFVKAKCL